MVFPIENVHRLYNSVGTAVPRGGSRKKYLGAWPLIIWKATTAKRNLSEITVELINSTSSRTTVSKKLGGRARFGGLCPPGPNVEPPLAVPHRDRLDGGLLQLHSADEVTDWLTKCYDNNQSISRYSFITITVRPLRKSIRTKRHTGVAI